MKNNITIYTNLINYIFFNQILSKYSVNFRPIKDFFIKNSDKKKVVILYKEDEKKPLDFNLISKETLVITNSSIKAKTNNNKIKIINKILSPQNFVKEIEKNLFKKIFEFKNILINEKKLKNLENNKSCYLTDIEKDIVEHIFLNPNSSRKYIKQKILNIKSSIETNSLDSHLTRIRKKLNQINASLIIESKNDILKLS